MTDEGMLLTQAEFNAVDDRYANQDDGEGEEYEVMVAKAQLAKAIPLIQEQLRKEGWKSPEQYAEMIKQSKEFARQDERKAIGEWPKGYCPHGHDAPVRPRSRIFCKDCVRQFWEALKSGQSPEKGAADG